MFVYEKKLQYPVRIKNCNPKLASVIISQYGGPDGELGASLRYLSQRYSMPYPELKGLLTDIGSEASEMEFSEASAFFSVSKAPVTPFATVKLHLCGSIFK
jgi:Mn-containing catalase